MPRYTVHSWLCPFHHNNIGNTRICSSCGHDRFQRHANVRESERTVIDVGRDGSISVPGRKDVPLHAKQVAAGVERVEVDSAVAGRYSLKHLEQLGLVHEATNWNSEGGNMPLVHEDVLEVRPKSFEQIMAEPDAF